MRHIRLIRLAADDEQALAQDGEYRIAMAEDDWPSLARAIQRVVAPVIPRARTVEAAEPEWGGYVVIDAETNEVVGSCAFKAPPDEHGVTEIAYFTYPGFEGRGYATAMARALLGLAKQASGVRRVIAHTLPEVSASTHVLEAVGLRCVGEVMDPEDGRVWRWELELGR